MSRQLLLLLAFCSVALALGRDLKTILTSSTAKCDRSQTTCTSSNGKTCCGSPLSVCCGDGTTCCPFGFICNDGGMCTSKYGEVQQRPAHLLSVKHSATLSATLPFSNTTCSTKKCSADETCCHDDWACCPVPEAICCKDKGHCCPHGYICDDQPFICRWPDDGQIIKTHMMSKLKSVDVVQCDSSHSCPESSTCCKLADGSWGCCPVRDGTCCEDHIHCCAKGLTCDTAQGRCISETGLANTAWVTKQPAQQENEILSAKDFRYDATHSSQVKVVQCDATHYCPNGTTCCKLANGLWGCCPIPNAVCCADHQHCCPSGYSCRTGTGECIKGMESIPWLSKESAITTAAQVKMVPCDATHYCPDGNTCCKLANGLWGCCPIQNAVCCADHQHCCPSGYSCRTGTGECIKGMESIPWLSKESAITTAAQVKMVQCDATHYCPDGNTCCKLANGLWGCCPIQNAVCCADHQHCCPSGYSCRTGTGECIKGMESIPWFSKESAITTAAQVEMVQCDSTHYCPDGDTCCEISRDVWGCCPVPNAVCCTDHQHCCPSGYTCSVGTGRCTRGQESLTWLSRKPALTHDNSVISWMSKEPARQVGKEPSPDTTVKCDAQYECPDMTTCCRLSSGAWGCCPYPQAVCCSDQIHCCPSGYICASNRCYSTSGSAPFYGLFDPKSNE